MFQLRNKLISASIIAILGASSLQAHSFWVNSFESFSHAPGHTTVSLGWGHNIPIDDILNSPHGKVIVDSFKVISPKNEVTKLRIPSSEIKEPTKQNKNFDVYEADVALQKIALKNDTQSGVYTIEAKSKPTFYTQYIDKKGKQRLKLKPMDKVKDIKKVLMSVKYQAFARSYLTIKNWEQPKAKNIGLEIIPKNDLSNVRVGDLVEFEVLFYGKPLNVTASSLDFITAMSDGFGQNDQFSLFSYIKNGKAQFRVQTPGQWIVNCNHRDAVNKDGALKDLYGKVNFVYNGATLTFNVKE